jgi:predicted dehydrogenase
VLAGIGGMGYFYLKTLLDDYYPHKIILQGAVDPYPERSALFDELDRLNIPVFSSLEDFYHDQPSPELTVISSPIQFHISQSSLALQNESHVLCEKPLTAAVQDADALIRMEKQSKNWVLIGYQWSFSEAIQSLKKDILQGLFGHPLRFKSICLWHRDLDYYSRCDWAGKIKTPGGGWVLDSPANNAMAHFLHNLMYLAGDDQYSSRSPVEITGEAFRAYPIENYDTVACRAFTGEQVEILFYASHAVKENSGPIFQLEFSDADISYDHSMGVITAVSKKGKEKKYGSPDLFPMRKLEYAIDAVTRGLPAVCGPVAARAQTLAVNGIQDSISGIINFPDSMIDKTTETSRNVLGLENMLTSCYNGNILPSEAGLTWAREGKRIELHSYSYFPGGSSDCATEEEE